jgi:IS30 family transposase
MRINNIIKNDLETLAKELKDEGKTLEEISRLLTEEAKNPISLSTVYRYCDSNEKAIVQAIEKSDKLKAKVADAKINTITKRVEIIDQFLEISEQAISCGDFRAAVMALRGATEAQDSLDERLGKLKAPTNTNTFNILNIKEQTTNARERFTDAVLCIANGNTEREYSQ